MCAVSTARLGNVLVRIALVFGIYVQRSNQPFFPEVTLRFKETVQFDESNVGDSDWSLSYQSS